MADDFLSDMLPPKKTGAQKFGPMAILSALLPVAMAKGGREGVAGLMQGFQSAMQRQQQAQQEQQRFGLQQQQYQDVQADRVADNKRQDAQLENTRAGQKDARDKAAADFWTKFTAEAPTWESPDEARQRIGAWAEGGSLLGIPAGRFESHALQMATPDALLKKRVQSAIKALDPKQMDAYIGARSSLTHKGEVIPFEVWSQYVPRMTDAQGAPIPPAKKPNAVNPGSFEEYVNLPPDQQALRRQQRKDFLQSDDRPPQARVQVTVGQSGLTQTQINTANALRDDYRTQSKDFFAARDGYERLLASATDPSPAGDVALLYGFMKLLDPNSVVRETEFATAARTGSLPTQIQAAAERVVNGQRLTAEQRADFLRRAQGLFGRAQNRQNARKSQYQTMAVRSGVPGELVIVDDAPVDESALESPPAAPPAGKPRVNPYNRQPRP